MDVAFAFVCDSFQSFVVTNWHEMQPNNQSGGFRDENCDEATHVVLGSAALCEVSDQETARQSSACFNVNVFRKRWEGFCSVRSCCIFLFPCVSVSGGHSPH